MPVAKRNIQNLKKPKKKALRRQGRNLATLADSKPFAIVRNHKWDESRIAIVKKIDRDNDSMLYFKVFEIDVETNNVQKVDYIGPKSSKLFKNWETVKP